MTNKLSVPASWAPRGWAAGLVLANNVTDPNKDIDIAPGEASDSANVYVMTLQDALTKRLDAAWAAGTNQGGLDTGAEAANTWYYVWLIRKDSDGSIDALFSTSATSPTMPAGYTAKRRLRSIRTNASSNILSVNEFCNEPFGGVPTCGYATISGGTLTQKFGFNCTLSKVVLGRYKATWGVSFPSENYVWFITHDADRSVIEPNSISQDASSVTFTLERTNDNVDQEPSKLYIVAFGAQNA